VVALWPSRGEVEVAPLAAAAAAAVRPHRAAAAAAAATGRAATVRVSVAALVGVDVVRPGAVAALDSDEKGDCSAGGGSGGGSGSSREAVHGGHDGGHGKTTRRVCPAFVLPAADAAAAVAALRARAPTDAAKRSAALPAGAGDEDRGQRVRLLAALRAAEVRNRSEAIRLLGLLGAW
jgi:hypothetical protein